jgi:hypothetical protein
MLALPKINAQQRFYSQSLQNLYWSIPETCRDVARNVATDTVVLCSDIVQGETVPLVYAWDENNVLEHIGYRFLPNSDTTTVKNGVVRFLERELLALLLTNDINQMLISYRENGLSIRLNNTTVKQSLLQNKQSLLRLLKNNQGLEINYDGKKYEVSLLCGNEQKLSFHFPADSELLTGMDKRERDIRLAFQLKNHKAVSGCMISPDYSYLQLLNDTVYVDKGSSFMIPQINNNLYYVKADSAYNLALDKSLIAESFANALLVPVGNNYEINITHRMYGKVIEKYTVNSRDFDDYFRCDYDRYFGVESLNKEKLTGTLILNDRNAGSIHLAFVSVTLDNLLNGGTMEIQLYSNIPQQNIKTLFGK